MAALQNIEFPLGNVLGTAFIHSNRTIRHAGPPANPDYLTVGQIYSYCEDAIVRATLEEAGIALHPEDLHRVVKWVRGSAKRIFLLLVYNQQLHRIGNLFGSGLTDDNLPLSNQNEGPNNLFILDKAGQRFPCFDESWESHQKIALTNNQWLFMARPLTTEPFKNDFHDDQPLEFRPLGGAGGHGGFGVVTRVTIPFCENVTYRYDTVAVKFLLNPFGEGDTIEFYNREKTTLELMRQLNHRHLIQACAAFRRGTDSGFIFPWADGGSLRSLWDREDPKDLNDTQDQILLLDWALTQIKGLCDGIAALHHRHPERDARPTDSFQANTRHGDLKPANILCFPLAGNKRGELKIADVGLAKFHREYTQVRIGNPTSERHASWKYAPPEVALRPEDEREVKTYSRKYDMWCFGCVLLEFLVWLTLGRQQLYNCFRDYSNRFDDDPFWIQVPQNQMEVSNTTISWMDRVAEALNQSPLQAPVLMPLLKLVRDRLLRINVDDRADSREALRTIKDIPSQGIQYSSFHFQPPTQSSTVSRMDDMVKDDSVIFSKSNNRTSNLKDLWEVVTDDQLIRAILPRMKWTPSLPDSKPLSKTCQACAKIDFRLSEIHLTRNLDAIRTTSKECAVCSLLDACLSKTSISPKKSIQLFQRKFSLSLSRNGPALLSLYSERDYDPVKLPYPQLSSAHLFELAKPQQLELLRQWIDLCDKEHHCLSPSSTSNRVSTMPKRLIDVGTQDQKCLCLFETSKDDPERYITLSHRWGNLPSGLSFQTKRDNIAQLKSQIEYDRLPQTFRDAVVVTRALGVRYLWIDSLCIIQDDEDDKKSQFGVMGDYYSSAYVTIAATSAKSSTEPFLLDRTDRQYATVPFGDDRILLAQAIDNFEADVEGGILNTRAWVLQERALSRRTIHFTSTQMYWECGQGIHCETLAQLRNPQSQFLGDHDFPSLGVGYYKDERIRLIQYLHETYTSMQLSFDTDRQFAVAGLHARLSTSKAFQSRMDYGVFWRSFERSMLWRAYDAESLTRITYSEEQSVPSWSWMAFDGKIGYHKAPFGKVDWTGDLTKPLTEGPLPSDHFKQGILAKARKVVTNKGDPLRLIVLDTPVATDFDEDLWRFIAIGEYEDSDRVGETLCCGLLIRPVFGVSSNVFQRAGAGTIRRACLSSTIEEIKLM